MIEVRNSELSATPPDLPRWPSDVQFLQLVYEKDIADINPFSKKRLRVFAPNGCTVMGKWVGTCDETQADAAVRAIQYIREQL